MASDWSWLGDRVNVQREGDLWRVSAVAPSRPVGHSCALGADEWVHGVADMLGLAVIRCWVERQGWDA